VIPAGGELLLRYRLIFQYWDERAAGIPAEFKAYAAGEATR
jgi:hypothetical protein